MTGLPIRNDIEVNVVSTLIQLESTLIRHFSTLCTWFKECGEHKIQPLNIVFRTSTYDSDGSYTFGTMKICSRQG